MRKITTCITFKNQAEEAAQFYTSLFKDGKLGQVVHKDKSVLLRNFSLRGQDFMALNSGVDFGFGQGLSFFVGCKTLDEINTLWEKLSQDGKVFFELKTYPWSERYGWCQDKYGVTWQLILAGDRMQIAPALLFSGPLFGRGDEALNFYTSLFKNSKVGTVHHDPQTKTVMHSTFTLDGQDFVLMEGQPEATYPVDMGISLVVHCDTQEEIDLHWKNLLSKGGQELQCGWVKDKYGVSWQVVPSMMNELLGNPAKVDQVMAAVMKMIKLDIAKMKEAYNS